MARTDTDETISTHLPRECLDRPHLADASLAHIRSEVATIEITHNSATDRRIGSRSFNTHISTSRSHAFESRYGPW
jgi:hypothetical protein